MRVKPESKFLTDLAINLPSPLEQISLPDSAAKGVEVWCKRDDLIHPIISGNKWRKLQQTLASWYSCPPSHVISFGGPYSNHLHALAFCCAQLEITFTAIVRGKYLQNQVLSPTLQDICHWQGQLHFVNKTDYQRRTEPAYIDELKNFLQADICIPEGGSQSAALQGVAEIHKEVSYQQPELMFDFAFLPVASGASLAGLVNKHQATSINAFIGVAVLKGESYLEELVEQFLGQEQHTQWHIEHEYHHGGYAKTSADLLAFCEHYNAKNSLQIEPVYSGKCFWAANDMIKTGKIRPGSRVLLLHTGGLQGNRAYKRINVSK